MTTKIFQTDKTWTSQSLSHTVQKHGIELVHCALRDRSHTTQYIFGYFLPPPPLNVGMIVSGRPPPPKKLYYAVCGPYQHYFIYFHFNHFQRFHSFFSIIQKDFKTLPKKLLLLILLIPFSSTKIKRQKKEKMTWYHSILINLSLP